MEDRQSNINRPDRGLIKDDALAYAIDTPMMFDGV